MESLYNYGSDEENDPVSSSTKKKMDGGEEDVNYDNITMDMSEESSSSSNHQPTSRSGSFESNSSNQGFVQRKEEEGLNKDHKDRRCKSRSRSAEGSRSKDKDDRKRRSSREDHPRDRERDRGRDKEERHRYRRSRSPLYRHERSRRSRSPRERAKHPRRDHSPSRRHRERSPRRPGFDRKPSKLSILEKLGIELKIPETSEKDGPGLPSYYNPVAMNPVKYAEQVAKRKLLWSGASKQVKVANEGEQVSATDSKGNLWQGATFSQDQDGKMTAKFQRLMGIRQPQGESSAGNTNRNSTKDLIKKQEELFSSMELQYEVARAATHTQRGVGLGFGVHHYPR